MLPQYLNDRIEKHAKKYKITDKQKKEVARVIEEKYESSKISPGEAIGIVTAESFGEPSTQMSLSFFEKIIVKINDRIKIMEIGNFVDEIMNHEEPIKLYDSTEVLPLNNLEAYVPSINQNEKIEWKKITEVSRHKSPKSLIKLKTASGRKIIATDNHSFVTRISNMIIPVLGKDLKIGSIIPSIKYLPEHCASVIAVADYIEIPNKY